MSLCRGYEDSSGKLLNARIFDATKSWRRYNAVTRDANLASVVLRILHRLQNGAYAHQQKVFAKLHHTIS